MTKPQVGMTLVDHHGQKYLTGDERQRFLAAVRTHRRPTVQTLASTLALTGCRISEALGLRAGDVDLPTAELRIHTLKRRKETWRAVPVPTHPRARPRAPRTGRPGEPSRTNSIPSPDGAHALAKALARVRRIDHRPHRLASRDSRPGPPRPLRRRLRTVTKITLPRAKRPKRWKPGCARVQLATLYRSLS